MATYNARAPIAAQSQTSFIKSIPSRRDDSSTQKIYNIILGGAGGLVPVKMRGTYAGDHYFWYSLSGVADPTGLWYTRTTPTFAQLTDVTQVK
jgi:hypothetical protein